MVSSEFSVKCCRRGDPQLIDRDERGKTHASDASGELGLGAALIHAPTSLGMRGGGGVRGVGRTAERREKVLLDQFVSRDLFSVDGNHRDVVAVQIKCRFLVGSRNIHLDILKRDLIETHHAR